MTPGVAVPPGAELWCSRGAHHAPADAFASRSGKGGPKRGYRQAWCRACQRAYYAEYNATRRSKRRGGTLKVAPPRTVTVRCACGRRSVLASADAPRACACGRREAA